MVQQCHGVQRSADQKDPAAAGDQPCKGAVRAMGIVPGVVGHQLGCRRSQSRETDVRMTAAHGSGPAAQCFGEAAVVVVCLAEIGVVSGMFRTQGGLPALWPCDEVVGGRVIPAAGHHEGSLRSDHLTQGADDGLRSSGHVADGGHAGVEHDDVAVCEAERGQVTADPASEYGTAGALE